MVEKIKKSILIVSLLSAVYLVMLLAVILISQNGDANLISGKFFPEGRNIWRSHNCSACHSIYGLGGHMGPDLTNVISRRGEEYVKSIVLNGGEIMPKFEIKREPMDRLVSYLEELDSSGKYPPGSKAASGFGEFR